MNPYIYMQWRKNTKRRFAESLGISESTPAEGTIQQLPVSMPPIEQQPRRSTERQKTRR